ncbi:hypothetical protein PHYSODRAFT_257615 [Phytophthora sojae]|uniref:ISXO2-like transposase domain-containing protein n=1 Tax=Phytophthora sojae (strain P6497) TaxID=1094619 RepID=G4YET5_PHYSP|nr:hypothetical protein PHYSODRAFT_257615 [Phytophthora sojae]EGZ26929.1 hypothetical protein PHYSODRAFT_257615 [Phytophthora sojae]|eukprot:XP_009514204.1 hypothetical protein PHYSODRAFT_257615 [Phytophthora sojae]
MEMTPCPMQVGGEGHVVEIDETSLKKKSKYNRGKHYPDVWLFGGVDKTTNKRFGILTYSNRTKPVLTTIIKQYIKPGTTIMSDQYASYVSVNQKHTLANYKPLQLRTGAHTNRIEGTWEIRIKQHIKRMRRMSVNMIPEYLDEYLWRSWFLPEKATPTDSRRGLIKAIRKYA